ncbi:hypothetical protein H6F67_13335 [Microcoleus sp. FACHB-1515]|uniref:Tic20 family protein n=1 Tax=Cyanophyceae TaxID=3028117 RepID=UPI001682B65E|nr:Tic20 family protein [Microcoleus sp. FACHB-1515]MBD2090833.1 hypothetical protein [Microcoleus sp. FACHB-1515]
MTWRGSSTPLDRVYASLPYLLPLLDGIPFGQVLFAQFPVLNALLLPITPLLAIYHGFPFASLIIFFAVFLLVVRNDNIPYFIRFNAMQAILLSIILALCGIVLNLALAPILGGGLLMQTLYNVIFLGTIAAVVYSIAQTAMGRFAEIPTLSDAVYMQLPR